MSLPRRPRSTSFNLSVTPPLSSDFTNVCPRGVPVTLPNLASQVVPARAGRHVSEHDDRQTPCWRNQPGEKQLTAAPITGRVTHLGLKRPQGGVRFTAIRAVNQQRRLRGTRTLHGFSFAVDVTNSPKSLQRPVPCAAEERLATAKRRDIPLVLVVSAGTTLLS